MKAFVSYSLDESEQYIMTILAKRLQQQGFRVEPSMLYNHRGPGINGIDIIAQNSINFSSIFFGVN